MAPAWGQTQQKAVHYADAANPAYWIQRWHGAVASHPYMGTVTVVQGGGPVRKARVWHGVRGAQQIDRIDMLMGGAPRTILRSGKDAVVWEGKMRRHHAAHESPQVGAPFAAAGHMDRDQLQQSTKYYRVVPFGQQQIAGYQTDTVGFMPVDNLRAPYRFWTERQTGLLLKWQMLEMGDIADTADAQAWSKARILREMAFADVQVPAPVDYAMLQNMLNEQLAHAGREHGRREERSRLQATTLHEQGWAWRRPLPGYVVKQCYWRRLPGMKQGGAERGAALQHQEGGHGAAPQQQVLQCLATDGLSRFSIFIGPHGAHHNGRHKPPPPGHAPERGGVRMASRAYAGSHHITAVGAVPQPALQHAVEALYRP